ncbi:MAG: zinc-ribbon domain-containing protein [Acidobacteria bacterium]|nr:zinc-ribbon domain-containing protein [Acidobacteriota bacterium]
MVEAIQCPSCQTRYGLRPARVRSGLRRAQCFRCGDVFHIEPEVKRLLAELEPAAASLAPTSTANVPLATLAEAIHAPEAASPTLDAHELGLEDLELPEPEAEAASKAWPSPAETAPIPSMAKAEDHPAAAREVGASDLAPAPEPETPSPADITGTYASAKDAISRLFGDTPLAPSPAAALRGALNQGRMQDVDAGLQALEDTLGGVKPEALSTRPFAAPETPAPQAAAPMQEADLPHAASTVRLTAAEMVAAVSAAPAMPVPEPPEITQEEVTMVLPPPPSAPTPALDAADPSALRLRIGDQVYAGLDLPTIAKWIEEGRVLEDHQVARGTSENWMDAAKVPALRPVFERLRRARGGVSELPLPPSGIGETGAKRGLFGGMFGKKD